jgi:FkbM family methyltransferase
MAFADKIDGLKSIWKFDNRFQLLFSRLLFRDNGLNVYKLNGMQVLIDHSVGDESGTRLVLVSPMYSQFLPQMNFKKPINVLDLGGNGGGFGLMIQQNGVQIKKIAAVEFNPKTCARMRFNMERNLEGEIVAVNAAVCGEPKKLTLQIGGGGTSDSIYQAVNSQNAKTQIIDGITIDDLYNAHFKGEIIDLCKMDIEGAEYEIFTANHYESMKFVRFLILEIHSREKAHQEKILAALSQIGFEEMPRKLVDEQDVHFLRNKNLKD